MILYKAALNYRGQTANAPTTASPRWPRASRTWLQPLGIERANPQRFVIGYRDAVMFGRLGLQDDVAADLVYL